MTRTEPTGAGLAQEGPQGFRLTHPVGYIVEMPLQVDKDAYPPTRSVSACNCAGIACRRNAKSQMSFHDFGEEKAGMLKLAHVYNITFH